MYSKLFMVDNNKDIIDAIAQNLFNNKGKSGKRLMSADKSTMLEQYKLLVDSAHKIEERRAGSNNIFIGINTITALVITNYPKEADLRSIILSTLAIVGILLAFYWLRVIGTYEKSNFINYCLIREFETLMPTKVFSLRAKLEEDDLRHRANSVLKMERFLPKVFLFMYFVFLIITILDGTNASKFFTEFMAKVFKAYLWIHPTIN